jgi:hypothetical protein
LGADRKGKAGGTELSLALTGGGGERRGVQSGARGAKKGWGPVLSGAAQGSSEPELLGAPQGLGSLDRFDGLCLQKDMVSISGWSI